MPHIIVRNASSNAIDCFVSKFTRGSGDDAWFTLKPGREESWERNNGWELVAFKPAGANETELRVGEYTKTDTTIVFHSFSNINSKAGRSGIINFNASCLDIGNPLTDFTLEKSALKLGEDGLGFIGRFL